MEASHQEVTTADLVNAAESLQRLQAKMQRLQQQAASIMGAA